MGKINYHKLAIEYLTNSPIDEHVILLDIIKNQPSAFCKVYERKKFNDVSVRVRQRYKEAGKIEAIKLYRELVGCSLRDARLFVEML